MFIPYKFTLNRNENNVYTLIIACRSSDNVRKVFNLEVYPLSYLEVSKSIGEIDDIIKILKSLLNTNYIHYNEKIDRYIVKGITNVDDNIKSLFKSAVYTPLSSSFILSNLQRKFFDEIDETGNWTGAKSSSSKHITILWSINGYNRGELGENGGIESINPENTEITSIIFKKSTDKDIQLWSTVPSMTHTQYFNNENDMINSFFKVLSECDINITYGGKKYEWHFLLSKLSNVKYQTYNTYDAVLGNITYKYLNEPTMDHIDLEDFSALLYPYLIDHKFSTITKNLLQDSSVDLENMKISIIADKNGNSSSFQKDKLVNFSKHLLKNMFLLEQVYTKYLPIFTNLIWLSGCNWGELTNPEIFRSIIAYINPLLSMNNLINRLPEEDIQRGVYESPILVPIGQILYHSLLTSKDKDTAYLGERLKSISEYSWIIKNIYNLEGIKPAPLNFNEHIFGFKSNCLFSKTKMSDVTNIENMSKIVVISSDSWVGITSEKSGVVSFTYKGLSEVCQHPFLAVKSCIELYLLTLISNNKIDKKIAIQATSLTKENTYINKKITKFNLTEYKYLLNDLQILQIENKKIESININIYYAKDNKYTTDYNNIYLPKYLEHLEKIMKTIPE